MNFLHPINIIVLCFIIAPIILVNIIFRDKPEGRPSMRLMVKFESKIPFRLGIHRSPVLTAIILNSLLTIISIYSMRYNFELVSICMCFTGISTIRILRNSPHLTSKKKLIVALSFILMIGISFFYANYHIEKLSAIHFQTK